VSIVCSDRLVRSSADKAAQEPGIGGQPSALFGLKMRSAELPKDGVRDRSSSHSPRTAGSGCLKMTVGSARVRLTFLNQFAASISSAICRIACTLFQFLAVPVTFNSFSTEDHGSFDFPTPFGK